MLTKLIRGSPIILDCPACGASSVEFRTFSRFNGILYLVVPCAGLTQFDEVAYRRFVVCSACDTDFLTDITLEELVIVPPNKILWTLRRPNGRAESALAISSMLFAVIPFAGVLLGLAFLLFVQRRSDWRTIVCWLSITVNAALTTACFYRL